MLRRPQDSSHRIGLRPRRDRRHCRERRPRAAHTESIEMAESHRVSDYVQYAQRIGISAVWRSGKDDPASITNGDCGANPALLELN